MQEWEYKFENLLNEDVFNRLGADGWELVTVSEGWAFFKRPIS